MKRVLFTFLLWLIFCAGARAQNYINYSATLFYNSTTNPKTVQLTLYVQNTNNGNGVWVDLAAIQFSLKYYGTNFTLSTYSWYPSGAGLDAAGDSNANQPDATSTSTQTITGKTYQTLTITRSTDICNNVLRLAPNSAPTPVFTATLQLSNAVASNYYDFTTTTANNYPGEFQNSNSSAPSSSYKDLLFYASSSYDQNGTGNSCSDGNIKLKSLNDDPSTPTVFTNTNAPLTVKWLSFNAFKQNGKAMLTWQTGAELNNKGFEIQRKDDNSFRTVAFVPSKSSGGNSSVNLDYNVSGIDLSLLNKTSYYRIKQVGLDNTSSYSEIKSVNNNSRKLDLLVYPNPSHGSITLIVPDDLGNISVSVADLSGKTIRLWNNYTRQSLQTTDLAKGFYLLKIQSKQSGESITQKITVY